MHACGEYSINYSYCFSDSKSKDSIYYFDVLFSQKELLFDSVNIWFKLLFDSVNINQSEPMKSYIDIIMTW